MTERQTEQRMGLFAQFMEYFFGVSWATKELPPDPLAPLCSACHNPAARKEEGAPWRCPHHPHAALVDPPAQGEGSEA
jgi:hypothetical protein